MKCRRYKKLHNKKLHKLHSSPGIIRMDTSRMMGCAGNKARNQKEEKAFRKTQDLNSK
jgi:hypothetical protein